MKRYALLLFVCLYCPLIGLLTGCAATLEKTYPDKQYYVLDISRPVQEPTADNGIVLSVRRFRISPRYENKELVYRTGTLSYESDFYNAFFIPPGAMITEEVRQWLAGAGLFQYVIDSASPVVPTHILEGNVLSLYGDYSNNASPKAVMAIQVFLMENISARSEILFQKTYRQEIPLPENTTAALINGWNEALRQILTALEADLRAIRLTVSS